MTFSYNLPSAGVFPTVKDEIRFLVRDTVLTDFSLTDEEINYLITFFGGLTYSAASKAAESISIEYAKQASSSRSVGDLSLPTSYQTAAAEYKALSNSLLEGPGSTYHQAYFTPVDTDGIFAIGQFDDKRP